MLNSLIRRECLSFAVTVLANCLEIWHETETVLKPTAFTLINKYGKGAVVQIFTVLGLVEYLAFRPIL